MPDAVLLTEAGAFTFGCAVLRTQWFDPERVNGALAMIAATLSLTLLLVLTPEAVAIDQQALDPACVWPTPR